MFAPFKVYNDNDIIENYKNNDTEEKFPFGPTNINSFSNKFIIPFYPSNPPGNLIGDHDYSRDVNTDILCFSGSGLRSLSVYTGILMSLVDNNNIELYDLLSNIETISGNSGGSWTGALLLYSNGFYNMINEKKNPDRSVDYKNRYLIHLIHEKFGEKGKNIFKKFGNFISNKFEKMFGQLFNMIGESWYDITEIILGPFQKELDGKKMRDSKTMDKNFIIPIGIMTAGMFGIPESKTDNIFKSAVEEYAYRTVRPHIGYNMPDPFCNNKPCAQAIAAQIMYNNNSRLNRATNNLIVKRGGYDNLYVDYKGWNSDNLTDILIYEEEITKEEQLIDTSDVSVIGAIAASSAAVGVLTNYRTTRLIINSIGDLNANIVNERSEWLNKWNKNKNDLSFAGSSFSRFTGDWIAELGRDTSVLLSFYPNSQEIQTCANDDECELKLVSCGCISDTNCPSSEFRAPGSDIEHEDCVNSLTSGNLGSIFEGDMCVCDTDDSDYEEPMFERGHLNMQLKRDNPNSYESTRLASLKKNLRLTDGGYVDNTTIGIVIRNKQIEYEILYNKHKFDDSEEYHCKLLSFDAFDYETLESSSTPNNYACGNIANLFGYVGKTFAGDIKQGAPNMALMSMENLILIQLPYIFNKDNVKYIKTYPSGNKWLEESNTKMKYYQYSCVTRRNDLFGIKPGFRVLLNVISIASKASLLPFGNKDIDLHAKTITECGNLVPKLNDILINILKPSD